MSKLTGSVAIVTGAGRKRGIGRATALRLATDGADVVVSAVTRDPASFPEHERAEGWRGITSLAQEIRGLGSRALAIECDVTNPASVQKMIAESVHSLGGIHIIINNAGVASQAGAASIVNMDDALWRRTIDVNLNGVYYVSKYAAKAMIERGGGGAIVNLSSMAGRMGMANFGAYCASKFGVIGLTQQMALELAVHGIRVNCVCPGSVDTDMMDGTFTRTAEQTGSTFERIKNTVSRHIPLGRQGTVSEPAAAIAFLASEEASYITGQTLNVDGGTRMD